MVIITDEANNKESEGSSLLDMDESRSSSSPTKSRPFLLLYTSHFLQTFGDRLWQCAVPLLLTELFVNTLFPQALFTYFTYLAVFLFMPLFGAWIDRTNRLHVVTTTIWIQNICIGISSVVMFILAYFHESIITHHSGIHTMDYKLVLSFAGLLVTSMLGQIMGNGATLALEQDWVVVLCAHDKTLLTTVNARMRRIDLVCKVIAPALFGIYTQFLGQSNLEKVYFGSVVIFVWNIFSLKLEWMSIRRLYRQNRDVLSLTNKRGKSAKKENAFVLIGRGWRAYTKSSVLFASIAYCMLYVNVLSGGVLVTSYLRFKGISYLTLGVTKGFGAVFGIFGTLITPYLHNQKNLSMESVGMITIWLFFVTLIPVGIGYVVIGENAMALPYIMLCCMIIARMGLWSFDLSINQLMQTRNHSEVRAQVNGTQVAFCQLFYMVSSILTMVFHEVEQFFIVIWVTLSVLLAACLLYSIWYVLPWCQRDAFHAIQDENENENEVELLSTEIFYDEPNPALDRQIAHTLYSKESCYNYELNQSCL